MSRTSESSSQRFAAALDVGQAKRIAERSSTRVKVLLPNGTDVTTTSLSYGPCEVVERSRDVFPADHVDQAVVPAYPGGLNKDVAASWNRHWAPRL